MEDQAYPPPEAASSAPLVLLLVLLVVAVLVGVAFLARSRGVAEEKQRQAKDRAKVATAIFEKIDDQVQIALLATGGGTESALRDLIATITATLGKTMVLGGGVGKHVVEMNKALAITKKEPAKAEAAKLTTATAYTIAPEGGGTVVPMAYGAPPAPTTASASAAGGAASVSVTGPSSGGSAVGIDLPAMAGGSLSANRVLILKTDDHKDEPKPPPKLEDVERPLTGEEIRVATRKAVEAFADFWQQETVEKMIKEAQFELITLPVTEPVDEVQERWPVVSVGRRNRKPQPRWVRDNRRRARPKARPLSGTDEHVAELVKQAEPPAS